MNLKVWYDDLVEKRAALKAVGAQISELADAGDKEGAMALKPQLEAAKEAVKAADEFYMSMVDASQVYMTGAARTFVPTSENGEQKANEVDRAGFEAMDAVERGKFLGAGGKVIE